MDIQEFIRQFAEQFDDTDPADIQAGTKFQELEDWSSLTAMGIIAFVKTSYGKTVTGLEIRSCSTVEELFHLVLNK